MRNFAHACAVALLATAAAAPAVAGDQKAELVSAGDDWNALYAKADWAGLRKLYTDDAWLMTDKAPLAKGADAIIAYLRRFRDMGATVTFRFEPEDARVDGKIGTVVAKYWMTAQIPGRPEIRTAGRSLLIYRREGGKWKLWRDMDNTTPDVAVETP
jgi:ketosteroid isomerase-like protein